VKKEFTNQTRRREIRLPDLKRRQQPNEAEVKARQQEDIAAEARRLQAIEDKGGEDEDKDKDEDCRNKRRRYFLYTWIL
jgi:hypothetical protein